MTIVFQVKNPQNNHILRCKLGKTLNLALLYGKKMTGISVPAKSFLERTPAADLFINKMLDSGFQQNHVNMINDVIKLYFKK